MHLLILLVRPKLGSLSIKTHKSYIISAAKVDSIDGNEIKIGNHKIPISRNLKEEVTKKLIGNRFLKR